MRIKLVFALLLLFWLGCSGGSDSAVKQACMTDAECGVGNFCNPRTQQCEQVTDLAGMGGVENDGSLAAPSIDRGVVEDADIRQGDDAEADAESGVGDGPDLDAEMGQDIDVGTRGGADAGVRDDGTDNRAGGGGEAGDAGETGMGGTDTLGGSTDSGGMGGTGAGGIAVMGGNDNIGGNGGLGDGEPNEDDGMSGSAGTAVDPEDDANGGAGVTGTGGNLAVTGGMGGAGGDSGPGSTMIIDTDGDGVEDALDNCRELPNPNQEDVDYDRIGDVCDANPSQSDVNVFGEFLILGGTSVNETFTLKGRATTGAVQSENSEFILKGRLSP